MYKSHSLELGETEPNILTFHTGILKWSLPFKMSKLVSRNKTSNQVRSLSGNTYAYTTAEKTNFNLPAIIILQYMNQELPAVQAGFRKGRGTRDQITNIRWIIKKARVPEKHLLLLYWLCQSLWLCGSQQIVENSERDGNTRPPYLPPEKSVCRSRSNS